VQRNSLTERLAQTDLGFLKFLASESVQGAKGRVKVAKDWALKHGGTSRWQNRNSATTLYNFVQRYTKDEASVKVYASGLLIPGQLNWYIKDYRFGTYKWGLSLAKLTQY
jgi:hypothetical protein